MDWRAFVVFSTTLLRDELDSEVFRTQTIFHSLPNISTGKKKHSTENVLPHDESGHPQNMPVQIVGVLAVGSQMKPQHENVMWQKAQDKHYANDGWKTEQMFHSICILQSKDLNISIRGVFPFYHMFFLSVRWYRRVGDVARHSMNNLVDCFAYRWQKWLPFWRRVVGRALVHDFAARPTRRAFRGHSNAISAPSTNTAHR